MTHLGLVRGGGTRAEEGKEGGGEVGGSEGAPVGQTKRS